MLKEKWNVVIATNNIALRKELKRHVEDSGMIIVDSVGSGTRLIDVYSNHYPDILFVDIGLDKMDGITACRKIQEQGHSPEIVYIISSQDNFHYDAGFEMGIALCIRYPLVMKQLNEAIAKVQKNIHLQKLEASAKHSVPLIEQNYISCKHKYRDCHFIENQLVFVERTTDRQCKITLNNGTIYHSSSSLKYLKNQCSDQILSPHRSF